MGKVYVLAKQDTGMPIQPTLSNQGLGLMINPSPENIDYTKFGTSESAQNRLARRFGDIGSKARYGLGALGALNAFYNATASGNPGALTSMGSGAMSGYYGSQGLERAAARQGAKVGVRRDNRESADAYDEAQAENEQRDNDKAMNMSYQEFQNLIGIRPSMVLPPTHSPHFGTPVSHMPAPGADANNSIVSNLPEAEPYAPTGTGTQQTPLTQYTDSPVAVIDPAKLKEMREKGATNV